MRGRVGGVVGPSSRIHGAPVQPPLGHWSERLEPAPGPEAKRIRPERSKQTPWGLVNPKSRRGHPSFPRLSKSPRFSPPIASVCVAVLIFDVAPERLATQLPALFVALGRGRVRKCRCIVVWASFPVRLSWGLNPAPRLDWGKNSGLEAETETARVDSQRPPSDSLSVPAHSWYSLNANPPSDPGASIRGDGDGA